MKRFVYALISVLCLLSIDLILNFVSDRELCLCLCGIALGINITCLIHFFIIGEKQMTEKELEKEVIYQRDGWGKTVVKLGKALGKLDEAKSIIKGLLIYIKHSCDVSYSNAIHE